MSCAEPLSSALLSLPSLGITFNITGLAGNAADSVIGDFDLNGSPVAAPENKSSGAA
ncbi:hypothetical protein ACLK19_24665 [Escherichia coli]